MTDRKIRSPRLLAEQRDIRKDPVQKQALWRMSTEHGTNVLMLDLHHPILLFIVPHQVAQTLEASALARIFPRSTSDAVSTRARGQSCR